MIEFTKGYDTEVADQLRTLREQGTPLIDFKTWLKQSAIPPEVRDMPSTTMNAILSPLEPQIAGDPIAERILLASVMEHPEHTGVLDPLHSWEFTQPLHQEVFRAIQNLDAQGIEPAASTVENWIRERGEIAPSPEWDSQFYRPGQLGPNVTVLRNGEAEVWQRKDLGLRGWHQLAVDSASTPEYMAELVRDRTILRVTTEAHEKAAGKLKEIAAGAHACDMPKMMSEVQWEFSERIAEMPPPYQTAKATLAKTPPLSLGVRTPGKALAYAPSTGPLANPTPTRTLTTTKG